MLNGVDLFSEIGGISYALQQYVRPLLYCENDTKCQRILFNRMRDGNLFTAPLWDDVATLRLPADETIDIVYGGSPCQDFSLAGYGKGLEGERSVLVYELLRICRECKPRFIFLENVPAICSRGADQIIEEIDSMGYESRWCCITAEEIGALHKRERFFMLSHSTGNDSHKRQDYSSPSQASRSYPAIYRPFLSRADWQEAVSRICPGTDGVSPRLDELKALGNSVVPQQVRKAFQILMGIKNN